MLTTAPLLNLYLKIASVSKYLVANQKSRQDSVNWGSPLTETERQNLLDLCYTCINWAAPSKVGTPELQRVINYMINLIGPFYSQANAIINGGSNARQLTGIYGGGNALTPYLINLTVSSGQAGVQTITDAGLIGVLDLTTIFIDNQVFQLGSGFTFNSGTGTISFAPAGYTLQTGDLISGLGFKPIPIPGGGINAPLSLIYVTATAGTVLNVPALVGKTISLLLRGGYGSGPIITSGSIVGDDVLFDNVAGNLTVGVAYSWLDGELLTIQFY